MNYQGSVGVLVSKREKVVGILNYVSFVKVHEEVEEKCKTFLNQTRSCDGAMGEKVFILRVRKPDTKVGSHSQ